MQFVITLTIFITVLRFSHGQAEGCFGEGSPRVPKPGAAAKGADNFGLKLFTDIATSYPHNSLVLSSYSVWSVLNLAYFGAKAETEKQLQRALGVSSKTEAFYGRGIIESQLKLNEGTEFNKADKAYFDDDLVLRRCAIDKLVEVINIDFNDAPAAAKQINSDVSAATNGRIRNFLSAGIIANARFVLINAVYFKGLWEFPFVDGKTVVLPFYDETNKFNISETKMMTTQAKLRYTESDTLGAGVLELPYERSNISMFLILPTLQRSTVNDVLQKLTSDALDEVTKDLRIRTVSVLLPKFKMTTRIAKELKKGLQNLGIVDLFNPTQIDLSNFLQEEKVQVDESLHQATIEVTEEGTVATAVTGLIGTRSGASRVIDFKANRPFIFLIRDVSQGITLFVGVLRNPTHATPL